MGLWDLVVFVVKKPTLQMKIYVTDSDRNVYRLGDVLVLFVLHLDMFADFLQFEHCMKCRIM